MLLGDVSMSAYGINLIRDVEPNREILVIIEDIEKYCGSRHESALLALLDGETQVGNITYIATTNYLKRLPPRLVNRPSRFDDVVQVGMPSTQARKVYMEHFLSKVPEVERPDLDRWANDTKGMSVAHIKELMVASLCLGQDYKTVLEKLRKMATQGEEEAEE